jgi:hypothetical protein
MEAGKVAIVLGVDVFIDKLTPCLEEVSTGELYNTVFMPADDADLRNSQKRGWLFNWSDAELADKLVYKLLVEGDDEVQGFIAVKPMRGTVYVALVESAPHNLPPDKKFAGVGGHLFAIAIKLSLKLGFGGFIHFESKSLELAKHYTDTIRAELVGGDHLYRMAVDVESAAYVIEKYTLEGEL